MDDTVIDRLMGHIEELHAKFDSDKLLKRLTSSKPTDEHKHSNPGMELYDPDSLDGIYRSIMHLKTLIDSGMITVREIKEANLQMEELKPEISFRENRGRRKKPVTGDSGVGSSNCSSFVSNKCPTCSRFSASSLLHSSRPDKITEVEESSKEKVEEWISNNSDFKTSSKSSVVEPVSICSIPSDPNDLSKPSATEHTESSESDNEKQPVYSSDEGRLSSINSIQMVSQETQTLLSASGLRMSRKSEGSSTDTQTVRDHQGNTFHLHRVEESFYELRPTPDDCDIEDVVIPLPSNKCLSTTLTGDVITFCELSITEDETET